MQHMIIYISMPKRTIYIRFTYWQWKSNVKQTYIDPLMPVKHGNVIVLRYLDILDMRRHVTESWR